MTSKEMAILASKLGKTDVRDRLLRALQFAARINKFASPEQVKILANVAGSLAEARKTLAFWKWIDVFVVLKGISSDNPTLYTLQVARTLFFTAFAALDNVLWCAMKGVVNTDVATLRKRVFAMLGLGICCNLLIGVMNVCSTSTALAKKDAERKELVRRRREGEQVDKEMNAWSAAVSTLRKKQSATIIAIGKDTLDLPIAWDVVRGGNVFDQNLLGVFGVVTSLVGVSQVWDKP
eukprot:c26606_g1_i1.p1 GENE.c26606_g1_i1~~c26606_g1_i1.p1  ORF type:complete len:236 (+),score=71.47 c26606_g1_i1:136-843(+)